MTFQGTESDQASFRSLVKKLALVTVGFLPLFYWHIASLLSRPHFQFILLLPLALLYLGKTLEPAGSSTLPRTGAWVGFSILLLAFAGGAYAAWAWSPWINTVCMLLGFAGVVIATVGIPNGLRYAPVWLFCWVLIPPPFGIDEDLTVSLRNTTTALTSAVLDHFNVYHQRSANIIELPGKPLFIADACSGIHSLYVLLAAAFFLCLLKRRSLVHSILLLAGTFFLVIIENVSRIVIIAIGIGYRRDFSAGLDHTILGLILFCFSMLLVASLDQLLVFAIPTLPIKVLASLDSVKKRLFPSERTASKTLDAPTRSTKLLHVLMAGVPVLGCIQLLSMPSLPPSIPGFVESGFDLPPLGKDALPKEIAGFTITDFKAVERVFGDPFGQASQQWTFKRGNIDAVISLDYPYEGLHDLCLCYNQIGWQIPEKEVLSAGTVANRAAIAEDSPVAEASMEREFYGFGYLLFSLTDKNGRTNAMIKDLVRRNAQERAAERFASAIQSPKQSNQPQLAPPFIQTQLFTRTYKPLTAEERTALLQLFCECRRVLNAKIHSMSAISADPAITEGGTMQ